MIVVLLRDLSWYPTKWSDCTNDDEVPRRYRSVVCQQVIKDGLPSLVDDEVCAESLGTKPALVEKCDDIIVAEEVGVSTDEHGDEESIPVEDLAKPHYFANPWSPVRSRAILLLNALRTIDDRCGESFTSDVRKPRDNLNNKYFSCTETREV